MVIHQKIQSVFLVMLIVISATLFTFSQFSDESKDIYKIILKLFKSDFFSFRKNIMNNGMEIAPEAKAWFDRLYNQQVILNPNLSFFLSAILSHPDCNLFAEELLQGADDVANAEDVEGQISQIVEMTSEPNHALKAAWALAAIRRTYAGKDFSDWTEYSHLCQEARLSFKLSFVFRICDRSKMQIISNLDVYDAGIFACRDEWTFVLNVN